MKCKLCGKDIEFSFGDGKNAKLKLLKICFSCDFWVDKFVMLNNIDVARINNNHYIIGKEDDTGMFRGFAGRRFKIMWTDGRWRKEVVTTNLWHQGEIPEKFRKYLPNNAIFVED